MMTSQSCWHQWVTEVKVRIDDEKSGWWRVSDYDIPAAHVYCELCRLAYADLPPEAEALKEQSGADIWEQYRRADSLAHARQADEMMTAVFRNPSTPDWAVETVHMNTDIHLGWRDRIRVLFGRTLHLDAKCYVDAPVGRTAATSRVWAESIFPHRSQGYGTVSDG